MSWGYISGQAKHYFVVTNEQDNLLYFKRFFHLHEEDLEGGIGGGKGLHYPRHRNPTWETVVMALPDHLANCEIISKEDISDDKIERIWESRLDKTQILREPKIDYEICCTKCALDLPKYYFPCYDYTKVGAERDARIKSLRFEISNLNTEVLSLESLKSEIEGELAHLKSKIKEKENLIGSEG